MIFHSVDTTFSKIKGCYKRSLHYSNVSQGISTKEHPLGILWQNIKDLGLDKHESNLYYLDYFAHKIDDFLKDNLLDSDLVLQEILVEWRKCLPIDPRKFR